jgi:hypothetical protein
MENEVGSMTQEGKAGEWISVKERLPKDRECVLLWNGIETLIGYGAWLHPKGKPKEWVWMGSYRKVTHWVPLPSPLSADKEER